MNIYIIGGGASGMLSSILIKRERPEYNVVLLEKNERVGNKLLVTGNGRCNFTNLYMSKENFHSQNLEFPMEIINNLTNKDLIKLFETLGIYGRKEEDGRVFPLSLQGSSLLDMLRINMQRYGVVLISHTEIKEIKPLKNGKIKLLGDKNFEADICILATGGKAMPKSGSDGSAYKLARDTGHNIIESKPSIVQVKSDYNKLKSISGVRIKTYASLFINDLQVDRRYGDVLFTDYGLSGPAILDLSRRAIEEIEEGNKVVIKVNLVNLSYDKTKSILKEKIINLPGLSKEELLTGIIHKKLIYPVFNIVEDNLGQEINFIYEDDNLIEEISKILTEFPINITGYKGFDNAQTTNGGVDTRGLKNTLESKIVDNLYFIGELVDVDGDCGGYNLQWAWSSAYTAAKDIIEYK